MPLGCRRVSRVLCGSNPGGAATAVGSYVKLEHIPTSFVAGDTYLRGTMLLNEQTFYYSRKLLVLLKMTGALSFSLGFRQPSSNNIGSSFSSSTHLNSIVYPV